MLNFPASEAGFCPPPPTGLNQFKLVWGLCITSVSTRGQHWRFTTLSPSVLTVALSPLQGYRDVLQTQVLDSARRQPSSGRFGAALTEDKLLHFQDEQLGQLYQLMLESSRPSGQALVHHPDPL